MTTSPTLQALAAAPTSQELLRALKDLKNSVIGNTWKKVQHAGDDTLLHFLLQLLVCPEPDDRIGAHIVCETTVVLGALGSAGALTLRPLLAEQVPARLLDLLRSIPPDHPAAVQMLSPLLRALRNILGSTADAVWGHMWGVGSEHRVVGTGLVGDDVLLPARARGKGRADIWRVDASSALGLVFEPDNRVALLDLLDTHPDHHVLLPLYQLLARLIVLPSHREVLGLYPVTITGSSGGPQFLIHHLLETILDWWSPGRRPNPKLLEAALDLVAALVKGQSNIAAVVREWSAGSNVASDETLALPHIVAMLVQLLETGPPGVRIAVAGCLTNILKADKGFHTLDRVSLNLTNLNLLGVIIKLFRSEAVEERVKLCFILAALVSDDERLQRAAADQGCAVQLISMFVEVDAEEAMGEIGHDAAARLREGSLLALASLAFQWEPTRSQITDASPPVLPLVRSCLSHPSYGVRAAACQLARALSRSIAILRTSLVDSGIGEEVVATLRREVARRQGVTDADDEESFRYDLTPEEELGDRAWTVEVAATATICNLVTDFSPLKSTLLADGGLNLLVELTQSPHEELVQNALWSLKNVTYHASDVQKSEVVDALTWPRLRTLLSPPTPPTLRIQALDILQNLLDDQPAAEMTRILDALGTEYVLDLTLGAVGSDNPDYQIPGLFILSHLALGSEKIRSALTGRVEVLEALSDALSSRLDEIRVPALRTLRHLIESNSRSHRPRQTVVDLLQPYQLKVRLRDMHENATSISVRTGAAGLLELLERAK